MHTLGDITKGCSLGSGKFCLLVVSRTQPQPAYSHSLLLCPLPHPGVMGEYEPKIEVHFPTSVLAARGVTVRLECFALGK